MLGADALKAYPEFNYRAAMRLMGCGLFVGGAVLLGAWVLLLLA